LALTRCVFLVATRLRLDEEDAARAARNVVDVALARSLDVVHQHPPLAAQLVQGLPDRPLRLGAAPPAELLVDVAFRVRLRGDHRTEKQRRPDDAQPVPDRQGEHQASDEEEDPDPKPDKPRASRRLHCYPSARTRSYLICHVIGIGAKQAGHERRPPDRLVEPVRERLRVL
jgi:hypothetical protein